MLIFSYRCTVVCLSVGQEHDLYKNSLADQDAVKGVDSRHCHSLSLASVKSRLLLPFWYRPTWVVPEKGPLNGCVCVTCCCYQT